MEEDGAWALHAEGEGSAADLGAGCLPEAAPQPASHQPTQLMVGAGRELHSDRTAAAGGCAERDSTGACSPVLESSH